MSGSDSTIFNNKNYGMEKEDKFKLITHHWGNNKNKGFALYSQLDNLLDNEFWKNKISFEFIEILILTINLKIKITKPLFGEQLAKALKKKMLILLLQLMNHLETIILKVHNVGYHFFTLKVVVFLNLLKATV